MRYKALLLSFCLGLIASLAHAQQVPGKPQNEKITISGVTIHVGNGTVIENGLVTFEDGIITYVGQQMDAIGISGMLIEADGKHLYPGFIAPSKSLGLVEINAVRATNDQDELGDFLPHVRSIIAYNAESQVVESMRPNGVLIGQVTPQGGRISGTSSIVQYDAWNWEDAVVKVDDGIHLRWPNAFRRGRWWAGESRAYRPNNNYAKQVAEVLDFMKQAQAYANGNNNTSHLPYEASRGLFDGSKKLYVYADGVKEITDLVIELKKLDVKELVLVGGTMAEQTTDVLKANNVPVLVNTTHRIPSSEDQAYDFAYQLPKKLHDAGLLVGIQNATMSNHQARNLPFHAGQAAAKGLDKETAVQMISLNTAKILGIDDNYGSIEVGKSATLFISEGDALDMRTNVLSNAFIDGRAINLNSYQKELFDRYSEKYGQ